MRCCRGRKIVIAKKSSRETERLWTIDRQLTGKQSTVAVNTYFDDGAHYRGKEAMVPITPGVPTLHHAEAPKQYQPMAGTSLVKHRKCFNRGKETSTFRVYFFSFIHFSIFFTFV